MGMVYEYVWIIGVLLVKKEIVIDLKENIFKVVNYVIEIIVKGLGFDVVLEKEWVKDY